MIRQILAVVQSSEEGYIAGFFDANVYASGDTEEEALRNLKSMILDVFDSLSREPDPTLGPEPRRRLAVFREFIDINCNSSGGQNCGGSSEGAGARQRWQRTASVR